MSFKEFLTEAAGSSVPVGHIEDHALMGNFKHAHEHLTRIHDRLTGLGSAPIKQQHHGDNITFGYHPDTGEFFVGRSPHGKHFTKQSDIHDDSALSHAFRHLKKVAPRKGVYSANVLFHKNSKVEDGQNIVFHAGGVNHIIPKGHENHKAIKKADIGLVVHTKHHSVGFGHQFQDINSHDPDLHNFKQHHAVYLHDPEIEVKSRLSKEDSDKVKKHLNTAMQLHMEAPHGSHEATALHRHSLRRYAGIASTRGDVPTAVGFKAHLQEHIKHLSKKGLLAHLSHVDEHHHAYENLLAQHWALGQAKHILHQHLNKHPQFKTTDSVEKPVEDHDFLSVHNGIASKLVNRQHK